LIVDDEPIAIDIVRSYVKHFPDIEIVAECRSALKAIEFINQTQIDLVFLDIQMPNLSGLDLAENLSKPTQIIFTTAFREFALEGFELDALDYLLKPISLPRFTKAISKFYQVVKAVQISPIPVSQESILIKENKRFHKIALIDLLFVESQREYLFLHTNQGVIKIKQTLDNFEESQKAEGLVRIHKSYLVNKDAISSFDQVSIKISDTQLPISRSFKIEAMKELTR